MTTVTLEAIKAEHAKVSDLIAAYEAQSKTRVVVFNEQRFGLMPGEEYAGMILGKDGEIGHHLILIPGEAKEINFEDAQEWAKKQGGSLPTRREQALLYANLKEQFSPEHYWSSERHASDSGCAWYQDFYNGYQYNTSPSIKLRARAVRRLDLL